MTQLIALVGNAVDAVVAIAGGARRVAVRCGSDTAPSDADLARLAGVGAAAASQCAVSLWWGAVAHDPMKAASTCGADEIWGGRPAPQGSAIPHWAILAPGEPVEVDPQGCAGIVIAGDDEPPRLLQGIAIARLEGQVRRARSRGVPVRLSGSMEAPDVPRLLALAPNALVFGDLLRADGVLDVDRVRLAFDLLTPRGPNLPDQAAVALPREPDRIFVRNWTLSLHLGAYGHERAPQRVRFTVEAEVERVSGRAADMRDVVTYDLITDAIARTTVTHVDLVETIAEDVAAMILGHPRVTAVDITVEKLDLGPGSLGCRIRRRGAPS